jgi:hypothetical protein
MKNLITIFYSEINQAEAAFRDYVQHKIKSTYDFNHPNLFSQMQGDKLDYRNINNELLYKTAVFSEIIDVRDKVKSIIDAEQQIENVSKMNQIILEALPPQSLDSELVNPYLEIIHKDIIKPIFQGSEKFLLIIYDPGDKDEVLKVETWDEKEFAATKICKLIVETQNDNDIISELDEIINSESIQFLKSIKIPIENHVNFYNHTILKKQILELLVEYWDIDYTVIYEISNAKQVISEDDFLMRLHDYSNYTVKENSIEINLNTYKDITGSDVDPIGLNFISHLKNKVEEIDNEDNLHDYENDIIQLLEDLSENTEIKIRSADFPKIIELKELKEKLEKIMWI